MYRDKQLREHVSHTYKIQQLEQNRLKKQREKQRWLQKFQINLEYFFSAFITFFSILVLFIWCVALSALDSGSWMPFAVLVLTTVYLGAVGVIMGYLR